MKLRNIILFAVTALLFASCSTTLKQRSTVDDLYYNPSEQTSYNLADQFSNEYTQIMENDSLKDVDSTIYENNEKSYSNVYDRLLVDDYNEAYQRRIDAMHSPYYGMNNYYNIYFSDNWWYANAFDPSFYNVIVMGNNVWVEPHYMSSRFGYGWHYNPLSHGSFFHNPYYGGFTGLYGYGMYSYYHTYSPWNSYGYGYYSYSPYNYMDPRLKQRKKDQRMLNNYGPTERSKDFTYANNNTRKRLQSDEDQKKSAQSAEAKTIRPRKGEAQELKAGSQDMQRRVRAEQQDPRTTRYIRTAQDAERERKASTYTRVERVSSQKYNDRNRDNTITKYIEAADRERSSVVNHRYDKRPQNNERTRSMESILRTSERNNADIRKRSTYSRPKSVSTPVRGSSNKSINRSSGNSNRNSGSSIQRTRSSSSSGNSSSRSSSSSSSSSSGRKRK